MKADELRAKLRARVDENSPEEALRRLRHDDPGPEDRQHLEDVLSDPLLGLDRGYSDVQYLRALCDALGLSVADEIEAVREDVHQVRYGFRPYLFVDTGFKRSDRPGMPIFVLACLESRRRVNLSRLAKIQPRAVVIREAQNLVRDHCAQSGGEIELWGTIKRYFLVLGDSDRVEIDVAGRVIGESNAGSPSRAMIAV